MTDSIQINGYKDVHLLSAGPYFVLYEGLHEHTKAHHWLQILDKSLVAKEKIVSLFASLVNLTPTLPYPGIQAPLAFDKIGGRPILIYEAFAGKSIRSSLKAGTIFKEDAATKIITETTRVLQFAQIRGIKHGWLGADFIFWNADDERIKVLGFGSQPIFTAMLLNQDMPAIRTIHNIPPENLSLLKLPEPSDAYALGCLFYELLSGLPPFKMTDVEESKIEKCSFLAQPNKLNSKVSKEISNLALSLVDADAAQRPTFSTILDQLDFKKDDADVEPAAEPAFKPSMKQRWRSAVAEANMFSGVLVGSKKRVVYAVIVAFVFLILVAGMFVASHISSINEHHLQKLYADFVAESTSEQTSVAKEGGVHPYSRETVSINDTSRDFAEKNSLESVSLYDREMAEIVRPEESPVDQTELPVDHVEFADIRLTLGGANGPELANVLLNGEYAAVVTKVQSL